jgi:uncharacterized protein YeaO (DUF488 family)
MPKLTHAQRDPASRIRIKRVYETAHPSDGKRILVDRLWPRGLSKDRARLTSWYKDIAPSEELRIWFHAHPDRWKEFVSRYLNEISAKNDLLRELADQAREHTLTLLFASKDEEHNNAVVLRDLLLDRLKRLGKRP